MLLLLATALSHAETQPVLVQPWSAGQVLITLPSQSTSECRSLEQCGPAQAPPPPAGLKPPVFDPPPDPCAALPPVPPAVKWLPAALHPACAALAETRRNPST